MMVALLACLVNLMSKYIQNKIKLRHLFNIPSPPIMHLELDDEFIEQFDEVFVIGDVHGCYDELKELLRKAKVDNNKVLKLFVGDLVNKGPKSDKVLRLLRRDNTMFSVRGNHDELVLNDYYSSFNPEYYIRPANHWILDLSDKSIAYLENLPYTISLPLLKSIIVHAGLVPGVPLEKNHPADMLTMRNIVEDPCWGKRWNAVMNSNKGVPWAEYWPGTDRVYFGHDAKRGLQQYPFAIGLDTGCVYGGSLTGIFIHGPRLFTYESVDAIEIYRPI